MGTRTFDYNDQLHLESESITGLYDRTVIRYYETEDEAVPGCSTGFSIGDTYDVAYGYDSTGRMDPVGWSVNGVEDTAEYSYLPNSNLLSGMTTTSGQNTSYIYEPQRNVKISVANRFAGNLISQYSYAYDNLGRRTSVTNSGLAFAQDAFSLYDYNSRNELVESDRYQRSDVADASIPLDEEYRSYSYDPIGNRIDAIEG